MTTGFRRVSPRRLAAVSAAIALAISGLLLTLAPASAASTCVVNNNGDAGAANAATGCDSTLGAGMVTLRSALERANNLGGTNTITFSAPMTITINTGLVADNGNITITGNGIDQTIVDAHHASRIFDSAKNMTISAMTLENGQGNDTAVFPTGGTNFAATSIKVTGSVVNSASVIGGVVSARTTSFTSSLIDNTTVTSTDGAVQGAVFNTGGLTLTDTIVSNTHINPLAGEDLDGVADTGGVTLVRSAITGTTATVGDGTNINGGIFDSGHVTLDHSAVGDLTITAGNNVVVNGGVFDSGGVDLIDSTVGHSRITLGTGGTNNGWIFDSGSVTMTNVTVADNVATAGANLANTVGNFNTGPVTAQNTIISKNGAANCATAFGSSDHSLDSGSTCGMGSANGNKSNQDPGLGAFQVNAPGTTQTMAIGATSPAYNTASNANCPTTDQRGVTRIFAGDPTCDMGAYEFVPAVVVASPSPAASVRPALPKAGTPPAPGGPGRAARWLAVAGLVVLGIPLLGAGLGRLRPSGGRR